MSPVVLVTGAAKRVGAAISRHLAREGWSVVLHYHHSQEEVLELAAQLGSEFPQQDFLTLQCDLSNMEKVLTLFDHSSIQGVELTALVNNASVFSPGRLEEVSPDFLKEQMDVNFSAPLFLMQAFKKRFPSGSVVNLLDTNVVNHLDTHAAYLLAKKALESLTQMAALAWAPTFRVNGVAPGPVLPPPGKSVEHLDQVIAKTPLKRQVGTLDIAQSVSFLLNNPSITGQVIFCDSGAHLI
jgi:pteridine reductase